MSHINTYEQKIADIDLFLLVCEQQGYQVVRGKQVVTQYGRNEVACIGSVKITGWQYNIAITEQGEVKYDHWGSQPGTMELLGLTIQSYNFESLMRNIPYDEIKSSYHETLENGDVQFILDY